MTGSGSGAAICISRTTARTSRPCSATRRCWTNLDCKSRIAVITSRRQAEARGDGEGGGRCVAARGRRGAASDERDGHRVGGRNPCAGDGGGGGGVAAPPTG